MHFNAQTILEHLASVEAQRRRRRGDFALDLRVRAVKAYQQRRFIHTYDDLLKHPRYSAAARFFLDELYGPKDFTDRDTQFARVVPALVRLFPQDIVDVVGLLAELHALSEQLDTAMAEHLDAVPVDAPAYIAAWQATGVPAQRGRQIQLTLDVGLALDRFVRQPLLRHTLRLMRGPARAAGLADLQTFLESGFDTFRAMRGADQFLAWVAERERRLVDALFAADVTNPSAWQAAVDDLPGGAETH